MSDELKPCPFCGATDLDTRANYGAAVVCNRCRAEGPYAESDDDGNEQAIAAWNTRVDDGARGHMAAIGALADSLPVDEDAEREVGALVAAHRPARASRPIDDGARNEMLALLAHPVSITAARAFVNEVHRHHKAPLSGLFAVGAHDGERLRAVAIVGRPVARGLQDGYTAEVTRLASDGAPNACSLLYSACWRAARALGYRKLITYTLVSENGASLRAANWRVVGEVKGRSWDTPSRPRTDKHPTCDKLRWEPAK